ncbi:MAG: hypothetical protein COA45_00625 [Zetaproteobacteria bacterium]|nr:MAG: hypothetical protein COA45_00625 [Zetaproteobacteria bacterium]
MNAFTKRPNSMRLFLGVIICIFAGALFISSPSYADEKHAPISKESFLKAWKAHQKNLPTTVTFEKTDEPNTYIYETTLFPYKGKLKILNVVVDKALDYYYDYDLDSEDMLKGLVEIEFTDLPEKFYKRHSYSLNLWERQNYLFYVDNRWMSIDQWRKFEAAKEMETSPAPRATESEDKKDLIVLISFAIFLCIWLFAILRTKKAYKKADESIEIQKQAFKLAEESLTLQKEQTDYLRQLLKDK